MCVPGSSYAEYTLSLTENSEKDAVLAEDIGLYSKWGQRRLIYLAAYQVQ